MRRTLLCLFIPIFFYYSGFSQEINQDNNEDYPENNPKFFTGGTLGIQFGSQTLVNVSPMLGYNITKNLGFGIGGTYQYFRYKNSTYNYTFSINEYGGRAFVRYLAIYNLFAYAEYEVLNLQRFDQYGIYNKNRYFASSAFLGPGYRERIGEKSYIYIMLLWNFNETPDSPYNNPILRTGIEIGLK
ncbi:MAG: hypothetical protein HXX09_04725 [Bacteroidetes bacterium]|nr:hypothetical protein [Bacteroidota bacterium]